MCTEQNTYEFGKRFLGKIQAVVDQEELLANGGHLDRLDEYLTLSVGEQIAARLLCIAVPRVKLSAEQQRQLKESLCGTDKCRKRRQRRCRDRAEGICRVQIEADPDDECEAPHHHQTPEPRQPIYTRVKQTILSTPGRMRTQLVATLTGMFAFLGCTQLSEDRELRPVRWWLTRGVVGCWRIIRCSTRANIVDVDVESAESTSSTLRYSSASASSCDYSDEQRSISTARSRRSTRTGGSRQDDVFQRSGGSRPDLGVDEISRRTGGSRQDIRADAGPQVTMMGSKSLEWKVNGGGGGQSDGDGSWLSTGLPNASASVGDLSHGVIASVHSA